MENYQLSKSEVVLYRNDIKLLQDGIKSKNKTKTEVLLTNENFIFAAKSKKLVQKETSDTIVIPIENLKIYNEMPYIIKKEELIEIYTLDNEYFLEFENKKEAKEFFNKAMRIASGCSKFVRVVKKVSKEIKDTNNALDIDIVNATKKTLDFAADVAIEYASHTKKNKAQLFGSVAKVFKKHNSQNNKQIEDKTTTKKAMLPSSSETNLEEE